MEQVREAKNLGGGSFQPPPLVARGLTHLETEAGDFLVADSRYQFIVGLQRQVEFLWNGV